MACDMTERTSEIFRKFAFVVELEADVRDEELAVGTADSVSACRQILADEITSNLESLRSVRDVVVRPVPPSFLQSRL
jgi:hypothetical protein